jgi:RNA polymerase sigma-B factor
VVEQLLDRLPERDRAVVELRFFEGLGQEEIATRIGVSQSYLSRMLRRILIDLRQMVDEPPADPG